MKILENYIYLLDENKQVKVIWKKHNMACIIEVGIEYPSAIVDVCRLSGVTLTEEILLKCGFDKLLSIFKKDDFKIGLDGNDFLLSEITVVFENKIKFKIQYLHQLQNLYFALTGKELEVNL
jgi:hypothetical protein